jgi:ferredoxin
MTAPTGERLLVDPARCAGVGICLHVAPDLVRADSWGYPVVRSPRDEREDRQAEAAVRACPRRALLRG